MSKCHIVGNLITGSFVLQDCYACFLQPDGHLLGKADLFALLYVMFSCVFFTFPNGALCQMLNLIVLIPDFCFLLYFLTV